MSQAAGIASATLPPALGRQVHEACTRFEAAWKDAAAGGPRPAVEEYLAGVPEPARAALFVMLVVLLPLDLDGRFPIRTRRSAGNQTHSVGSSAAASRIKAATSGRSASAMVEMG
jgi:hypothetical protein